MEMTFGEALTLLGALTPYRQALGKLETLLKSAHLADAAAQDATRRAQALEVSIAAQHRQYEDELSAGEATLATLRDQIAQATADAATAKLSLDHLLAALESTQGEIDAAQAELATVQATVTAAKADVVTAQTLAQEAGDQRAAHEAAAQTAAQAVVEARAKLASIRAAVQTLPD